MGSMTMHLQFKQSAILCLATKSCSSREDNLSTPSPMVFKFFPTHHLLQRLFCMQQRKRCSWWVLPHRQHGCACPIEWRVGLHREGPSAPTSLAPELKCQRGYLYLKWLHYHRFWVYLSCIKCPETSRNLQQFLKKKVCCIL